MPELREVFEIVRNQTERVPDAWEEQERRQRRVVRNRKIGAIALSVALVLAAVLLIVYGSNMSDRGTRKPTGKGVMRAPFEPGLYLVDLTTHEMTRVPGIVPSFDVNVPSDVAVSSDGSMVAYVSINSIGRRILYVANINGTSSRPLERTVSLGGAMAPAWSPDGSQIVYQAKGAVQDVGNLFLVDVATGETTQLTNLKPKESNLWYMAPTFSPDGQTILFQWPHGKYPGYEAWDLWAVPASGGKPMLLRRDAAAASFSPDGRTIAYMDGVSTKSGLLGDVWLASADGTDARPLVNGRLLKPAWSPDGTRVAYVDHGRDGGEFVVDVSTRATMKIVDDPLGHWPVWVDDHTWILGVG